MVAEGLVLAHHSGPHGEPPHGMNLEVEPGKITALVGPNGAGKSTLILVLLGLVRSRAGRVTVAGMPARTYRRRHGVGFLPEDPLLPPGWTVAEWIGTSALVRGLSRRHAAEETAALLSTLGLSDLSRRRIDRLSRGTTRRVALAFALAGNPSLVMLDEPLSGLDPSSAMQVRDVVLGLRARGATVLVTTHDLRSGPGPVDRAIVLERGQIVERVDAVGRGAAAR